MAGRGRFGGPPDEAVVAKYARVRRRTRIGIAVLLAGGFLYLAGLAAGWIPYSPPLNGAFLVWLLFVVAGAGFVVGTYRCPRCHRYLVFEARIPGSRNVVCPRCGALLR